MNVDYYKILEIDKEASSEDIKRSYRRLSLKYHPDKNSNDLEKTEKFKLITEAYTILGNIDKRKQYDMMNNSSFNSANMGISPGMMSGSNMGMGMNMGVDIDDLSNDGINYMNYINNLQSNNSMSDFLNMLFTQQNEISGNTKSFMSQNQRCGQIPTLQKPKSIKKVIEIDLYQSFAGCVLPVEINRWIMEHNMRTQETETLYINIPKGIDNNELIVVKHKGNCISEFQKGDIKIMVKIKDHDLYTRKGLDLFMQKNITFKESICGFSFNINHIDGRTYKINSDSGFILANNNQKVINNLGMERDEHKGNLIIVFTIIFPQTLSAEQIEKLNEIL